jgi:hydroxypyruvate reductase
VVVVGAGKAAAAMLEVVADRYGPPLEGVVVVPYGTPGPRPVAGVTVLEAGHPVPDAASVQAGRRIRGALSGLEAGDVVLALISGGGSALLAEPAPGLTLEHKQAVSRALLGAGATIAEINCVRRKLSGVKGGRLALAAQPAAVTLLAISDVPGDRVADIASGPFSPDPTTLAEARSVLARYDCPVPPAVGALLGDAAHESPRPGDPVFRRVTEILCARSADALAAAAGLLAAAGYEPLLLDAEVNRDAGELAREHARLALQCRAAGRRVALVTGGETTVPVTRPAGRGGRNSTYLLALALALDGAAGIQALAADTDGVDGSSPAAGAVAGPDSLARARAAGLDPAALLAGCDSFRCFEASDGLVITGLTGTNANDLRLVLVDPAAA